MTDKSAVLAFDTSNYTTSAALLATDGELIANLKKPLAVKAGERGLRQSDALFLHTVNIPDILSELRSFIGDRQIVAVGVSDRPRNTEGSYMPCFLCGVSCAESAATVLGAPLYRFSHQCGHIMAALYSSGKTELLSEEFAAFHISGGTTELVRVKPSEGGFETELLGGTSDLNAGQVIDRIGVYMGLSFPAGPEVERLALENKKKIPKKKISSDALRINLSGLENLAVKLYKDTEDKSLTAAFVFDYIGRAIASLCAEYEERYGKTKFVCAGGVMCNSIIKRMLAEGFEVYFAEPLMSADNAVGCAALTLRAYLAGK